MALALNLDIDFELADKITVANLQESYRSLSQEISNMEIMMKTISVARVISTGEVSGCYMKSTTDHSMRCQSV